MRYAKSKGQTDDCYDDKLPVRTSAAECIHPKMKQKASNVRVFFHKMKQTKSKPSNTEVNKICYFGFNDFSNFLQIDIIVELFYYSLRICS